MPDHSQALVLFFRAVISITRRDVEGVALFVKRCAQVFTVHGWRLFLNSAHVVHSITRELRVIEFRTTSGRVSFTLEHFPIVLNQLVHGFLWFALWSYPYDFNPVDVVALIRRIVA